MYYITAKTYSVDVFEGHATYTFYGKTSMSYKAIGTHQMHVSAELFEAARTEGVKLIAANLVELIKERNALQEEVEKAKEALTPETLV